MHGSAPMMQFESVPLAMPERGAKGKGAAPAQGDLVAVAVA
ncbi:hypothetical protein SCH4B_4455 [Ruegeria sp. TrichCH4B]|nr:hypothetical protein SCH4B_4455 [Ruegeria sp. TrichCH4B]